MSTLLIIWFFATWLLFGIYAVLFKITEPDSTKFDISTLIITRSSHSMVTEIDGYDVEFIFKNINLPFDDDNNDGYIAFKIKTLPTLQVGDIFENDAEIYFDYNAPITTNKFQTKIVENL